VRDGGHQGGDPLLAGHAADEQDVRLLRVDPMALQRLGAGVRTEGQGVDPVVDDMDTGRVHVEMVEDVLAGRVAHRDDGVRPLERLALHPGRGVVAAPQLLPLPRPQRLEGMDRDDERQPIPLADHQAPEVGVPGVAVDEVRRRGVASHGQVPAERRQHRP
jgi:hypothetical protein